MDTKITFINKSWDANNSKVVIFQENIATNLTSTTTAWKVIQHCGYNWKHQFTYTTSFDVAVVDAYENHSNFEKASFGEKWVVEQKQDGNILKRGKQNASGTNEVEIQNNLAKGSIDAQIIKDGNIVACKTGVSPKLKAAFQFEPYIYVGVHSEVVQGKALDSAILMDVNTKICLAGVNEAQLIMTGGGVGPNAVPFEFELVRIS